MSDKSKTGNVSGSEPTDIKGVNTKKKNHDKRRKFLASITTGAALAGAASGGKWVKPVVDSVILPSHAQTSQAVLNAVAEISGNEFTDYAGIQYNADGSYPIVSNDSDGFDDFLLDMHAIFNPSLSQSMTVNMDVNIDGSYSSADIDRGGSQSISVAPGGLGTFAQVEIDADDVTILNAKFNVRADGFATRNVTFNITT